MKWLVFIKFIAAKFARRVCHTIVPPAMVPFGLLAVAIFLLFPLATFGQLDQLNQPLTLRWRVEQLEGSGVSGENGSDRVYVVGNSGAVYAVRLSDGEMLWRADLGGEIATPPLASQSGLYLASESSAVKTPSEKLGQLRQLSRQGGITTWATLLPSPWVDFMAITSTALYGCGRDGRVQAINRSDGRRLWTSDPATQCLGGPITDDQLVFVFSARGEIIALSQNNGMEVWRYRTKEARIKNLAFDDSNLYAATIEGTVYALDRRGGKLRWSTRVGSSIQFLGSTSQGLLVTSLDNYAYCLATRNGKRRWKYKLDGRPLALPLVTINSVFLLNSSGSEGIVLDMRSGKPVNRLPMAPEFEPIGNPIMVDGHLLVPTRQGLIAFAPNVPAPAK